MVLVKFGHKWEIFAGFLVVLAVGLFWLLACFIGKDYCQEIC